jgi:hypothetical protein
VAEQIGKIDFIQALFGGGTEKIPNTGWFGTFTITNISEGRGIPLPFIVKLAHEGVDITPWTRIVSGETKALIVPPEKRLPDPNSLLEIKYILETGVIGLILEESVGWKKVSNSGNPFTEENTLVLLPTRSYELLSLNFKVTT